MIGNQKTHRKTSKQIPSRISRPGSRSKTRYGGHSANRFNLPQKIILAVIAILAIIVVLSTIFALNYDSKHQVETKISDLARTYYEEYFYANAFGSDRALATNYLNRYAEDGLYPVTLRQILLLTPNVSEADADFLKKYCDQSATSVTYYPTEPFTKDSFRTEFSYSCEYE